MANSTKISEYSTTAANNTSIDSIDIDENCAASGINNAIRSVLKHQADAFTQGTPIKLDQTNNRVMINTTTEGFADYADTLTVADTDHAGITIRSGASSSGSLYFSDATSGSGEYDGYLNYNQSTQEMAVGTAATTRVLIDSDGHVGIGDTTPVSVLEVRKNSVSNGRLATFGSNGTASTDVVSGLANAITIGRSYINVPANTTTNLVSGYGGSLVLVTILQASGVADVQRTVLLSHAWSSASVLFENNYGGNSPTITFSALSSNLRVNHNHSGALNFNVQALIVPGPSSGG